MIFAFDTVFLRRLFEKRSAAISAFGAEGAREFEERIADLRACTNIAEFEDLFPGVIVDRGGEAKALRLGSGFDLAFCAGHVKTPTAAANSINWTAVTRLRFTVLEPI